jgi:hypothetical protein
MIILYKFTNIKKILYKKINNKNLKYIQKFVFLVYLLGFM